MALNAYKICFYKIRHDPAAVQTVLYTLISVEELFEGSKIDSSVKAFLHVMLEYEQPDVPYSRNTWLFIF